MPPRAAYQSPRLVICADPAIYEPVQAALQLAGLPARTLSQAEMLQLVWSFSIDLLIIEAASSYQQTVALCHHLRRFFCFPILLLERGADEHERIALLDAGADDVLAVPRGIAELPSRCSMLLRRVRRQIARDPDSRYLRAAGLRLDIARCRLLLPAGAGVDLTAAQTRLLALLVSAQGACVAVPVVSQHVFGAEVANAGRRLAQILRDLERRIARLGMSPPVDYVKGHGYRVVIAEGQRSDPPEEARAL